MATIINTPAAAERSSSGMGFVVGVILLILFVLGLLYYGLPALSRTTQSQSPQINVPDKVDVTINQPTQPAQ